MGSYKAWKPPQTERKSRSPSFSGSKPTICKANPKGNNKQVRRNEHVHRATKPVPFLKYTVSVKNNRKQTTSTRRKDKACQILCYAYIVPEFWYWALPAALGERDVVLDAGKYLVLTWCKKNNTEERKHENTTKHIPAASTRAACNCTVFSVQVHIWARSFGTPPEAVFGTVCAHFPFLWI